MRLEREFRLNLRSKSTQAKGKTARTLGFCTKKNPPSGAGFKINGGWGWIRTSVRVSEQIYSLPPLTTRTPIQQVNLGLCHGFRRVHYHKTTPRPCRSSQALAAEKWPQPTKGRGGRRAESGEGWLAVRTRCRPELTSACLAWA